MVALMLLTSAASAARIKLYIDESRSMQLGLQTWFRPRCAQAAAMTRVTDLLRLENLRNYDVAAVWNQTESIQYSPEEIEAVKTFVAKGGGLLIIGNPGPHTQDRARFANDIFPQPVALPESRFSLNGLSGAFGPLFSNASRPGSPNYTSGHPLTDVSTLNQTRFGQPLSCLMGSPKDAKTIATAFGHPVIVALSYGKGRVIVCGASRLFMNYGKLPDVKLGKHDTEIAAQQDLLVHWLEWLSANSPCRESGEAKVPLRIPGRVVVSESGITVYTIPPFEPTARQLAGFWKKAWPELARTTGLSSPIELVSDLPSGAKLEVYLCAAEAGGLSAANRVALPAVGGDERLVGVLGHEVGHKLLGGCNTSVSEAFAEWLSIKALAAAGLSERARAKEAEKIKEYRDEDPTGSKLNVSDSTTEITKSKACQGKWIWILKELEREHGDTFLKAYVSALRSEVTLTNAARKSVNGVERKLTMGDHIRALSKAAGKDLAPWFKELGITSTD